MPISSENLRQESDRRLKANARVVYRSAAAGIRPDPQDRISAWAAKYRVVPDMGSVPGPWRNETAPYLVEPMDALSPEDPCEHVVIIKPAQSGGSAIAENFLGFVMHRAPGPAMYVGPTVKAAKDWHQEKLQPTIEATPVLAPSKGGVVAPQKSRSGEGSTSERIRFRGGYLLLAGANSAATLRQHSIRFMVRDDRSAWTDNADGEGDPKDLSDKRLKTYRVFGLAKVLDVSSPKFKGADIDADYQRLDQRRYYLACRNCRSVTDFDWEDVQKNPEPPYHCRLICPACGTEHTEAHKAEMVALGAAVWIPTAPDADGVVPPKTIAPEDIASWRDRPIARGGKSYAITGVMNTFDRWEMLAAQEAAAGDDPEKVQPFQNGDLGRAYEPKSDGPAWEVLSAHREMDWERGAAPAGVLYVTLTVDVKADGLHWQRKGWGPNKQGWHIDYGFIPGETDAPLEGAWPKLDAVVEKGYRFGKIRLLDDLIGVDSGYNSEAVYDWVKRRHNALALKGVDGWNKLPMFRAEAPGVRTTGGLSQGKALRHGIKVWLVGTYGIKGALMIYLARLPKEGGAGFPTGYHHFPANADEEYFRHLTSEYVKTTEENGELKRVWEKRGPNHWLDCEVYGWALAFYAGLWTWNDKHWEQRAAELTALTRDAQADLFTGPSTAVAAAAPIVPDELPAEPAPVAVKPRTSSSALDRLAGLNQ